MRPILMTGPAHKVVPPPSRGPQSSCKPAGGPRRAICQIYGPHLFLPDAAESGGAPAMIWLVSQQAVHCDVKYKAVR